MSHIYTPTGHGSVQLSGLGWGMGSRVPGAAWRSCPGVRVWEGGGGSNGEGRCSDLLYPQFPKRDGCRVPFAVTRLPCSVCDPLLPTNLPVSGASLRPQRPCPQAGFVEKSLNLCSFIWFSILERPCSPFYPTPAPTSHSPVVFLCFSPPSPRSSMQLCLRSLHALP